MGRYAGGVRCRDVVASPGMGDWRRAMEQGVGIRAVVGTHNQLADDCRTGICSICRVGASPADLRYFTLLSNGRSPIAVACCLVATG